MNLVDIHVTFGSQEEAQAVTDELLSGRLVACVNLMPVESKYWWQGKLAQNREVMAMLKTTEDNWPAVCEAISSRHSYQTPVIIKLKATANQEAWQWIRGELKK